MHTRNTLLLVPALSLLALAACSAHGGATAEQSEALTSTVHLAAHGTTTFTLDVASDEDATLTVDCKPPQDPDEVGPVFGLSAPSLDIDATNPTPAGYFARTLALTKGQHELTFTNEGAATTCSVGTKKVPAANTCRAWSEWRSKNTDHTHLWVGTKSTDWEPFPASGDHWGAWAKWGTVYDTPIQRGFLLHNLEHGGIVFSYKCHSADESQECTDAQNALIEQANALGAVRVIVTPDPEQPQMYGARAWRWAYTSDCYDADSMGEFVQKRFRHGREDIDADPPIPYDPTTKNVPCQDLMAAPDSCP